jgi:hypothetical protein
VNLYSIEAELVLPFRAALPASEIIVHAPTDKWETSFEISYPKKIVLFDSYSLYTTLCTFVKVSSQLMHKGDEDSAREWAKQNSSAIVEQMLQRVNHLFILIKKRLDRSFDTGIIRNVGEIDLILCSLIFNGQAIFSRTNSTFLFGISDTALSQYVKDNLSDSVLVLEEPSKEWMVLTRAVDLVNHGYFLEAFVVSFALLDDVTQKFVVSKLESISADEAKQLLRKIETQRLETYLGTLSRLATGKSILDDKNVANDLKWINTKRNNIMHNGENISLRETQRGMNIVLTILKYFHENGMELQIPERLGFWSIV